MKKKTKVAVGIGAGLAAAGVAAYLLTGKNGKQNRAKIARLSSAMKKEAAKELKKIKSAKAEDYIRIIEQLSQLKKK